MITKSPSMNIPNFDYLYNVTKEFIKEHQGEKGYIEIDVDAYDRIYSIEYEDSTFTTLKEFLIYAVRVKEDDIQITIDVENDADYLNDEKWKFLRYDDRIYYIPTLLNIAEFIEEYIEE